MQHLCVCPGLSANPEFYITAPQHLWGGKPCPVGKGVQLYRAQMGGVNMGRAHLVLSCWIVLPTQAGPAPPVPVLLGSAGLEAMAGEGKMKRDLRVLCHLHKETGDQDFPFSPAPVPLCCVHLPA